MQNRSKPQSSSETNISNVRHRRKIKSKNTTSNNNNDINNNNDANTTTNNEFSCTQLVRKQSVRKLARRSSAIAFILLLIYCIVLLIGFATIDNENEPFHEPWITILEICILFLMPAFLCLFATMYEDRERNVYALLALLNMALCVALTTLLHFMILTTTKKLGSELANLFEFKWPSIAYAIDIVAWDIFFALAYFFCAISYYVHPDQNNQNNNNTVSTAHQSTTTNTDISNSHMNTRGLFYALLISSALSFFGLLGVLLSDMKYRNIGIVGYVGGSLFVLPLFYRHFSK